MSVPVNQAASHLRNVYFGDQVLYNLFEWPASFGRLAVIGVSNTHDLDERVLPRISSRLGNSKLVFHPYDMEQLSTIIEERLKVHG